MPETPCGCTDGNGDGSSSAVPVFFGGAEEGCPPLRACGVACRAIHRLTPFQGAEVQANAASVPRAHPPLAAGASFGREMWVISSMAFSLDGWSACETVFTAEQVGRWCRERPVAVQTATGTAHQVPFPFSFFGGGRGLSAAQGVPGSLPSNPPSGSVPTC